MVNIIKHLFSRHQHPEGALPSLVNWAGQSGKTYPYQVYPLDTPFQPLPGNFVYAKEGEDGGWVPIYMAQTRDLHQRLEGHVRLEDAVQLGATHIHAHYCSIGQAARCSEERDLILRWQPEGNDPVES